MQHCSPQPNIAQDSTEFRTKYEVPEQTLSSPKVSGLSLRRRKGRCYELAYRGVQQANEWRLVHGEVDGPPGHERIGHAWLELGETAYNPTDDTFHPCWRFRIMLRATPIAFYPIGAAHEKAAQFGHFGPWH